MVSLNGEIEVEISSDEYDTVSRAQFISRFHSGEYDSFMRSRFKGLRSWQTVDEIVKIIEQGVEQDVEREFSEYSSDSWLGHIDCNENEKKEITQRNLEITEKKLVKPIKKIVLFMAIALIPLYFFSSIIDDIIASGRLADQMGVSRSQAFDIINSLNENGTEYTILGFYTDAGLSFFCFLVFCCYLFGTKIFKNSHNQKK